MSAGHPPGKPSTTDAQNADELSRNLHVRNIVEVRLTMLSRHLTAIAWHYFGTTVFPQQADPHESCMHYLRLVSVRRVCCLPFLGWARLLQANAGARLNEIVAQAADLRRLVRMKDSRRNGLVDRTLKTEKSLNVLTVRVVLQASFRRWRDGVDDLTAYRTALGLRIRWWLNRWWRAAQFRRQYWPVPLGLQRLRHMRSALGLLQRNRSMHTALAGLRRSRHLRNALRCWARCIMKRAEACRIAKRARWMRARRSQGDAFRRWLRESVRVHKLCLQREAAGQRRSAARLWARIARCAIEALCTRADEGVCDRDCRRLGCSADTSNNCGEHPIAVKGCHGGQKFDGPATATVSALSALGGKWPGGEDDLRRAIMQLERSKWELSSLEADRRAEALEAEAAINRAEEMLRHVREEQSRLFQRREALAQCEAQLGCLRKETIGRTSRRPVAHEQASQEVDVELFGPRWMAPMLEMESRLSGLDARTRLAHRRLQRAHHARTPSPKDAALVR